jgi:hypothetical protein
MTVIPKAQWKGARADSRYQLPPFGGGAQRQRSRWGNSGDTYVSDGTTHTHKGMRDRDRHRCKQFRKLNKLQNTISLIDDIGNTTVTRNRGQIQRTQHNTVLSTLQQKSLKWRNNREHPKLSQREFQPGQDEDIFNQARMAREEQGTIMDIRDDRLTVHGDPPGTKPHGVTRLIYENANGLNNRLTGNAKLNRAKEMIHELQADIVAYNEHRINLNHKTNINGFRKMFTGGELDIRAIASCNAHINVGRIQEGGTCLIAYGPILGHFDNDSSGKDESGLGRWTYMTFKGSDGFITRVVCGYNPCYSSKPGLHTVYQQQKNYWRQLRSEDTCPRRRFKEDLVELLTKWRTDGDRLIVCMDANEDIYRKSIGKTLTDTEGLAMREVVGKYTGRRVGATYFRGSHPIDAVWATSDLTVVGAPVMPCGYGIGDHRLFIVDFVTSSMVGDNPIRIVRPEARRLNTRIPKVTEKYVSKLEDLIRRHRLIERIGVINESTKSRQWKQKKMNNLDQECMQYMLGIENKCRKLRSGIIPFSPEAVRWIRRAQVYRSLLQLQSGRRKNIGNLKRLAKRVGIDRPTQMSRGEILVRLRLCEDKCQQLKRTGWMVRRKFLRERTQLATKRDDLVTATKILAIIQREKDRRFWGGLHFAMGKKRGRSVSMVQVEQQDGTIVEHTSQQAVEETIFNEIHRKRFFSAEDAPICKPALKVLFGYQSRTRVARKVLKGEFLFPPDFDEPTKALSLACIRMREAVPKNSVSSIIRRQEWSEGWKRAREDTSSSESGLHFGHYKAGAESPLISHLHALKASVLLQHGITLERWSRGLSVMIEKVAACSLISKLWSILLMEADFNFMLKRIFGYRMLENIRRRKLIPEEIFSEQNRTADDGTLSKVLFYDISRQMKRPAGVASVDADNCFDQIAHAMASLCMQAFGVPSNAVASMLGTIKDMKFFLRTAYGDSKSFAGSTIHMKTQGLCQGSGAAPAGWAVVSIVLLDAHKREQHGAQIVCPISKLNHILSAIIFVDDTDLIHLNLHRRETLEDTHDALQISVSSWGGKLIASGGALKPMKCFYHLIDYVWSETGEWSYRSLEEEDLQQFKIRVPTPSGNDVAIEHLGVNEARKTLGTITCPSGASEKALSRMKEQASEWIDKAKNGSLSRRSIWLLLRIQLWPRVAYGLGCSMASLGDLEEVMQKAYYMILPIGGVIRSAPKDLRMLDAGFCGIGCPHTGVEGLIAQLNKLLMHYGCQSSVGSFLQASMEAFILELGLTATDPFSQSYERYGHLITHCWLKTVWEKCDCYKIRVTISNLKINPPREGDKWLIQALVEEGYKGEELRRLNKVRIHQQALYLLDVLNANGRSVDLKYLDRREELAWSTYIFPEEDFTETDLELWRAAVYSLSPASRPMRRVREYKHSSHKIWNWRYDEIGQRLLYFRQWDELVDVYTPSNLPGALGRANRWMLTHEAQDIPFQGELCSTKTIADEVVSILGWTIEPEEELPPTTFVEVLKRAEGQWMWDDLTVTGDIDWIHRSIEEDTVLAVMDGSYMEDLFPDVCAAAFILECTQGRGTITGSFTEQSEDACAYRGEIMGLMAIQLILACVSKAHQLDRGGVNIHCDCLGALDRVKNIPFSRIPVKCKHSDVLKNVLVNCGHLPFLCKFHHVRAHQDDSRPFHMLDRTAQLNCMMDEKAKEALKRLHRESMRPQLPFPLEPLVIYAGKRKISTDCGDAVRFWTHMQLAKPIFAKRKVLDAARRRRRISSMCIFCSSTLSRRCHGSWSAFHSWRGTVTYKIPTIIPHRRTALMLITTTTMI